MRTNMMTEYPLDYVPAKNRDKLYGDIVGFIQASETRIVQHRDGVEESKGIRVPISLGDAAFLTEELWKGRSAVTGLINRLVLVRWKRPEGKTNLKLGEGAEQQKWTNIRFRDLVCMTRDEALRHEKKYLKGEAKLEDLYGADVIERVEARLAEAAEAEKFRL